MRLWRVSASGMWRAFRTRGSVRGVVGVVGGGDIVLVLLCLALWVFGGRTRARTRTV